MSAKDDETIDEVCRQLQAMKGTGRIRDLQLNCHQPTYQFVNENIHIEYHPMSYAEFSLSFVVMAEDKPKKKSTPPQVMTLADGRTVMTVDLPGMPAQTVLQEGVDYTTFSATLTLPEGCVCPDCNGTGEYRGLTAVEPCRTCRKGGAVMGRKENA